MTVQLPFSGVMDLDNSNETIQPGYHKSARNILFKGVNVKRAENIKGTRQIAYSLPAGANECIGSYYDATKQRTIWFNYNSNNNHGIYQMVNGAITPLTVCGGTDYLNFTKYPIHSINIIHGDSSIGDLLFFIDSLKRPTKINIDRAIASGYGTMERSFINVSKSPPRTQPVVAYANDLTTTINNITKNLFQFAYSFVFDDKEESVLSSFSELPVPPDYLDINALVTTNAKITVALSTGGANVMKIKVYVRRNIESLLGDWALIDTLDKSLLAISNNTTYAYDFKNNTTGIPIYDVKYATLLYDSVPREANSQELINGNIVAYGAIKEGYNTDFITSVSFTVSDVGTVPVYNDLNIWPLYDFWSKYSFGLVYFDDEGRTNGVVTDAAFNVTTHNYDATFIPFISATINHRPPAWATTYEWVRTKNLTKSKSLMWISDSTYKDDKFAYIGIQSLYDRNKENKDSILSYDFSPGDRIRFISLSTNTTIIGKDYAIEEFINSPDISYINRSGFFIKIKLPTTSGTFDFGSTGFGSYLIELYTPAAVVADKLNTFFEFGEKYTIGNAGLSNRFHNGGTQNQTANLSQPATFTFWKGDVYVKPRDITTGGRGEYRVNASDGWKGLLLLGISLDRSTITNETYLFGSTGMIEPTIDVLAADANWIVKTQADAYTFRFKGTLRINLPSNTGYRLNLALVTGGTSTLVDIIPTRSLSAGDNVLQFDVSVAIPANTKVYLETDNTTDTAIHYYETEFNVSTETIYNKRVVDPNFSDVFLSAVNSNGRPFVVDEGLVESFKPSLIRFSEAYQTDTSINRTNRFYDLNYVECDRSKGAIQRLKARGDMLRAIQYRGVLPFGIYKQMLTNADGSNNLIQSEKILNRLEYYQGDYGIGNQPCSLASSSGAEYFTDPVRGYHIRLAGDGMTPISELYKAQFYLPPVVENYLQSYTTDSGSASKILGTYDFTNEEFVSIFQKCKSGSTVIYAGDALGFSEQRNGYSSFYDYTPESIVCAEGTFISWKSGAIYVHDSSTRNTFYGVYFPSQVDVVINTDPNVKKEYTSIGYHANTVWECPVISTETGNESNLIAGDFDFTEGMFTAAFGRDINSVGGWADGSFLVGVWQQLRLQNNSTSLAFLHGLYLNYLIRQKTF